MALEKPYCTVAEVKQYTGDSDLLTGNVETAINHASRFIDEYTGKHFRYMDHTSSRYAVKARDITERHLYLPFPCITLTKLEREDEEIDLTNFTYNTRSDTSQYTAEDCVIRAKVTKTKIYIDIGNTTPVTFDQEDDIKLTGEFGYGTEVADTEVTEGLPAGIGRACVIVSASLTDNHEIVPMFGQGTPIRTLDIQPEAFLLLDRYRRIRV
ncbi:MAG: hypothetical protein CMF45_04830 [Legionellales bacterium]|nr:hypothetical protein [Legionellales bacterium]